VGPATVMKSPGVVRIAANGCGAITNER
jgi:hypothetical protein